ncbi:LOW QUALITY PROTEIN: hypothetical protein PHMEG_00017395 [Phytophthora megakarya]|uniref:Integrase catalytic domain-containing protein n=1 Tax=Phytophthora megakarya TaxID=4795 RepID=A0A225VWY3_9STRA|nr:LOW QUALITY PROTEIN: hypothetical protein PHMEG_00017395 [Phytophthora megakarya]
MTNEMTEPTMKRTDDTIIVAQGRSKLVQRMLAKKAYADMEVGKRHGLVVIRTLNGYRVILPPELWKRMIRFGLAICERDIHRHGWHKCIGGPDSSVRCVVGLRDAKNAEVVKRDLVRLSLHFVVIVVERFMIVELLMWQGHCRGGQRYVIAALEYVTRYAVAAAVEDHTAENVAAFLMKNVVIRFGPFRELLTDAAPELTGHAIEELVQLLQAKQTNPVPYRPQMIGLVERHHRTWKDVVAVYMQREEQHDWETFVDFAVYAYNSASHSTVALSPNELMMGRRLRQPKELLRATNVTEAGDLTEYHLRLVQSLKLSHECAEIARRKEHRRQARYYDRKVRNQRKFKIGDRVWLFRPSRGPKVTKFVQFWIGPLKIVDERGYENFLLQQEDGKGENEQVIAHVSFLVTYHYPVDQLRCVADDIENELRWESEDSSEWCEGEAPGSAIDIAAAAPIRAATATSSPKRGRCPVGCEVDEQLKGVQLVELRRRRRLNKARQYVLEYEVRPVQSKADGSSESERLWIVVEEYDTLFDTGQDVEDLEFGEDV